MRAWAYLGRALYFVVRLVVGRLLRGTLRTRILVVHGDSLLLIQDWIGNGQWVLPGGGLHKKEPAASGASRELREETGLAIDPSILQDAGSYEYNHNSFQFRYQLFALRLVEQQPVSAKWPEVISAQWVPRGKLTTLKVAPEVLTAVEHWPQ